MRTANPMAVIVGMCGSGKSTVAEALRESGWEIVHFGSITMRELEARGLEVSEANERTVREELRETHGPAAYAKLSLPVIAKALRERPVAVDGLYSWAEYKLVKEELGDSALVFAVCADRAVRYDRLARRPVRPLTAEEARQRDYAEIEKLDKGGPIAIADRFVLNNGTEAELRSAVKQIARELTNG